MQQIAVNLSMVQRRISWLGTPDLDWFFYFQINKLEGKALEDRWEQIKIHLSDLMIMVLSAAKFLAPVDQIWIKPIHWIMYLLWTTRIKNHNLYNNVTLFILILETWTLSMNISGPFSQSISWHFIYLILSAVLKMYFQSRIKIANI